MQVAALFMRALDNQGDVYLPYSWEGDWTVPEKNLVACKIAPHVPNRVDAMFNNWLFSKYAGRFFARRATWDRGCSGDTLEDFVANLEAYYK
jgi:hypothetical protein